VCSPLGLRLAIEDSQQGNFDFLSSIEMVIVDQCEVLLMQNWAHLEFIFERLNQMPKRSHETDFSRVRQWYLDDQMKSYRQTLLFSRISHVDINFIMNRFCQNMRGRVKISEDYRSLNSVSLSLVTRQLRQVFHRVNCETFADADDARFEYFATQIYNHVRSTLGKGTLIYVPSYFDYVRLKNFLKKKADEEVNEEVMIAYVSEYSKTPDASRSRTRLFKEQLHMMVYTERYHFYHRFMFRGVKNVVFYSPPQLPQFYSEIVNLMADDGTCLCLFTKFDVYQLEPIVGVKRSERMITSDKSTFLFC
jgi:U3 small nucleolar RNA-associated protein 25